ncbi:MAG TPA: formyltransferase [Syntrophorhabdales bacterium]|nr:formyltransferase [Syntrophorhabdales bacterium]
MRAAVFAYHEIGYVCLEEVLASGMEVACLFTHKDDPDEEIWFRRPVDLALEHAIPVYDPERLRDGKWTDLLKGVAPDFIFSFYYRYMIPQDILDCARLAALNLHGSLLPKFRGRCPVNWVLIKGEKKTGVTLHVMEVKPDAGDIVAQREVDITFEDTAHSLFLKLASAARTLMKEILPQLLSGEVPRAPQTGASSYFGGRRPEDGLVDWSANAHTVYNLIRAVTHPYPGAFTFVDEKKLFIWKAEPMDIPSAVPAGTVISLRPFVVAASQGALRLVSVQLEGEPESTAEEFVDTHKLKLEGKHLGGTL